MAAEKSFVLPLMTINEEKRQLWTSFATATFAAIDDKFFLVSPAHALAAMDKKPVYLPTTPEPISLAHHAVLKTAWTDIAAIKLNVRTIDALANDIFFVTDALVGSAPNSMSPIYCEPGSR